MSGSFEKSVKGATKIKAAPPKTKYIEHILVATHSGEAGTAEVFRSLNNRLRDSTWTVVFKSLITVHLMIREGSPDVTLSFLAQHRQMLAISNFSDAQTQGRNIRHYANYLSVRARAYRETQVDYVRAPENSLEKLTVDRGLLRETEFVQRQLSALLKCDVLETEPENDVTIAVFRLLVLDLLALFQALNLGLIKILGSFFEMPRSDADRAMDIYRTFARLTDFVVAYLAIARQHEHHTRVEVPKLKHAPVNLTRQLEDYLKDPDFEVHRRQYMSERGSKGTSGRGLSKPDFSKPKKKIDTSFPEPADFPEPASNNPFPKASSSSVPQSAPASAKPQANRGPDPDLIDFFGSIEQNQTPMQVNPQQTAYQPPPAGMFMQSDGFAQQPAGFASNGLSFQQNPGAFMQQQQQPMSPPPQQQLQQQQQQPIQPNFTGAGFGGFTPQPSFQPGVLGSIPQNSTASFQNQQQQMAQSPMQTGVPGALQPQQTGSTNPFRQSTFMQQQPTGLQNSATPPPFAPIQRQSTNPFVRSSPQNASPFTTSFQSPPPQQMAVATAPLQPIPTGTNPFARSNSMPPMMGQTHMSPQPSGAIVPQPTGDTNPFRQGAFVNHTTGQGWQHNQAPIGGGIDQLSTTPVFPRPAQQTPWQQQQQ